jgi:hypothetical protein
MYNFDDLKPSTPVQEVERVPFIGSYPPVTPPGQDNGFFVNTYFLQPDRKSELAGPVPVRSVKK